MYLSHNIIYMEEILNHDNYYFIGIGGSSMSALAGLLVGFGKNVSGSDLLDDAFTKLNKLGIKTYIGHKEGRLRGVEVVVYNMAISETNVELVEARKLGIPCYSRAEFLAMFAEYFDNVIAISGTHGKTTTTAMISNVLLQNGCKPTIHMGGCWSMIGGNGYLGSSKYFVTEACEYKASFLALHPTYSVITNIEKEHMDYYKTVHNLYKAFGEFARQTNRYVVCPLRFAGLVNNSKAVTFGYESSCDYMASNIYNKKGVYSYTIYIRGVKQGRVLLNVPGKYNILNSLASFAVCDMLGIPQAQIYKGLKSFCNVDRRFDVLYQNQGLAIVQDYAHHPTEIHNFVQTAKKVFGKVYCVFQPHTYSRTKTLLKSFAKCFCGVEKLFLLPTYESREQYDSLGSIEVLKGAVKAPCETILDGDFSRLDGVVRGCIAFVGAGDIEQEAKKYVRRKKNNKKINKSVDY